LVIPNNYVVVSNELMNPYLQVTWHRACV